MPPVVRLTKAATANDAVLTFTGVIAARVQSDPGFRVPGKIEERFVNTGEEISAGQPLMRIAQTGPREALVALPETMRPDIESPANARMYGPGTLSYPAYLRQLPDSADLRTRTYEVRYVLGGEAATAPLGATVTIQIPRQTTVEPATQVPLGALLPREGLSVRPETEGGEN